MSPSKTTTTAVSAPGKALLAGGYLVLDRAYTGFVFGLSARINVVAQDINTVQGVQLTEIVVESPQFLDAQWRYGYHLAENDGGIKVTQLHAGPESKPNPFVETTLSYALTYVSRASHARPSHSMKPARLTILADNDYYSQPALTTTTSPSTSPSTTPTPPNRFAHFPTPLHKANKTGLGSSAALVTSLTAALLTHYLDPALFDLTSPAGKRTLHNLAQAAHCAAQGKVGSGFDVAAAVYGSILYRRFSPSLLEGIPEPGSPGFAGKLEALVNKEWDVETTKVSLPKGVAVRMCDVDCGSQTVGMVKGVLKWRGECGEKAKELWDALQERNQGLAELLDKGQVDEVPDAIRGIRKLIQEMTALSGVPIEPESQTELLDGLAGVEGVYGGVVPGAGGYDAVSVVAKDDEQTGSNMENFLERWSKEKGTRVRLLGVKGEMEGVRTEDMSAYHEWIR